MIIEVEGEKEKRNRIQPITADWRFIKEVCTKDLVRGIGFSRFMLIEFINPN